MLKINFLYKKKIIVYNIKKKRRQIDKYILNKEKCERKREVNDILDPV